MTAVVAIGDRGRCRHRGPGEEAGHEPERGGQLVRLPARVEVDPGARVRIRLQRLLQPDRLGRRHRRDPGGHGRLRSLGRSAFCRPVRRLQGLRPDSVGAVGDVHHVQPAGGQLHPSAHRPDPRQHLPRQHHGVERPGDQEDQPEVQPVGHEDHSGLSLRQLGYHVQLHRLPVDGQPDVEVEAGRRGERAVAGGRRCSGQLGSLGCR